MRKLIALLKTGATHVRWGSGYTSSDAKGCGVQSVYETNVFVREKVRETAK